jgi:hypothetical protein
MRWVLTADREGREGWVSPAGYAIQSVDCGHPGCYAHSGYGLWFAASGWAIESIAAPVVFASPAYAMRTADEWAGVLNRR